MLKAYTAAGYKAMMEAPWEMLKLDHVTPLAPHGSNIERKCEKMLRMLMRSLGIVQVREHVRKWGTISSASQVSAASCTNVHQRLR
jgi:hypothetical protein